MNDVVYFSKTEKLPDGNWLVTIAPKSHVQHEGIFLSIPKKFEEILDNNGFYGLVIEKHSGKFPHQLVIKCYNGFPCVGMKNIMKGNFLVEQQIKLLNQEHMGQLEQGLTFSYEEEVVHNKTIRQDTDVIIQRLKDLPPSRERALAITKLQEGVMWVGMDLKRLGESNPYPSSKDPSTGTKIEPTADNLKL